MIQGIPQGQKQASLTHRRERERNWAAEVPLVASTHSVLGLVFYFLAPPAPTPLDTPLHFSMSSCFLSAMVDIVPSVSNAYSSIHLYPDPYSFFKTPL